MHYCSSFCLVHRPTQGVSLKLSSNQICPICFCKIEWNSKTSFADIPLVTPCCKNTWFHNSCLQVTRISFLKHCSNSCLPRFGICWFYIPAMLSICTRSGHPEQVDFLLRNLTYQMGKGPGKFCYNNTVLRVGISAVNIVKIIKHKDL